MFIDTIYIILLTHTETLAVKHVQRVVRSKAYKGELYRLLADYRPTTCERLPLPHTTMIMDS